MAQNSVNATCYYKRSVNPSTHRSPYNELLGIFIFLEERLKIAVCVWSQDLRLHRVPSGPLFGGPFGDTVTAHCIYGVGLMISSEPVNGLSASLCTQAGELIELSLLV